MSETTLPWPTFAWWGGDGARARPGIVSETEAVARAGLTLKCFSMLKPPHVDRSALVVVAVAPLPDQLPLTVNGSGIPPPGGGPPLPEAMPANGTAKPGQLELGSVMVTLTLAF